ncbi:putative reverse transcriptase zinc-binding domain-containing protein [Helianthus anomalus]
MLRNVSVPAVYCPSRCKWIPRKCSVFIWRLGMNKLATMDALKKRNMDNGDGACVLCGDHEETVEHLFTACGVASTIWSVVSRKKDVIQGIVRIGCWCIWKSRNDIKFNNKEVKIEGIVREIKSFGLFWYNARSRGSEISWPEWRSFVNM